MKKLLATIVLSFCVITSSYAGDLKDFEVSGISIFSSLLDYFNKDEIKKNSFYPEGSNLENSKYISFDFENENVDTPYSLIHVVYEKNNYKIHSVSGRKDYKKNIAECYKKMDQISDSIVKLTKLNKSKIIKTKFRGDKSGKSFKSTIIFTDKNENLINIICYDFDKNMTWTDTLSVAVASREFVNWNTTIGYKKK